MLLTLSPVVIIYYSETALDIVLNALAIAFINEVDDLIVTKGDNRAVLKIMQEKPLETRGTYYFDQTQVNRNGYLQCAFIFPELMCTAIVCAASPVFMFVCY